MAAAVSASLLPVEAARPLAGSTLPFGGSYQKKKKERIPMVRGCCAADDQGEISPLLPSSCRYVPTCRLAANTLCRHTKGGHGYDPPRWFGEEELPEQ